RGIEPHTPAGARHMLSVGGSHPNQSAKVNCFTRAPPDFLEPCSWFRAMNNAAPQKAQPVGGIVAVPPDVLQEEGPSVTESTDQPAESMTKQHERGRNRN